MIDWLRGESRDPTVTIGERVLPLAIRRHARAKRMTMRLAPDGSEVRITLPPWGRTADALVFVKSRGDWLDRQLAAVPRVAPPAPGGHLTFRGDRIAIDWAPHLPRKPDLGEGTLRLGGPAATIPARVQRWLEAEAVRLMEQDLAHYCERAGQPLPQFRLSRAKRRWGSCSGPRNADAGRRGEWQGGGEQQGSGPSDAGQARCIRINWRLIQAPDAIRRSVVAHEVAHLVHFDHSAAFHALLAKLFEGDLPACDAWLRREGRGLYAALG